MNNSMPSVTGRILAAAKNYQAHIEAMADGQAPPLPVLFAKPPAALRRVGESLWYPGDCEDLHPEAELVVLVGARLRAASLDEAEAAVAGYAAGLDMTDRGWQGPAKVKGYPWEYAKGFDGSAALGPLVSASEAGPWEELVVRLRDAAGALLQEARPKEMTLGVPALLAYASERFTLEPGDLVFTGAPAGTKPVAPEAELKLELVGHSTDRFRVTRSR